MGSQTALISKVLALIWVDLGLQGHVDTVVNTARTRAFRPSMQLGPGRFVGSVRLESGTVGSDARSG